ncbi:hypothetical protein BC936DRAFT_147665 [Jimgerdemannia flammicorona]|uniref:HTH TFE/IIEalpha-type domain-containing protein n=1 Tax=Jimgerdemannia flammicorona TaxID=994334 RepID=A0A433D4T5_9FUNG|nr:hypothetical protein BC936DRAFT_147665 [Jimgerdemannia flammicorona]
MAAMDILRTLVNRVARAFYEPKYIVILDALNKADANTTGTLTAFLQRSVKDEDLALTIKVTIREIHKICGKLKEDRLLKMITRNEPRKADQRAIPKTYYYIDYKQFVDVVKWKMYKMQSKVLDNLKTESENRGYICNDCKRTYGPLQVVSLVDMRDQMFHCEVCVDTVLQDNDNAKSVKGSEDQLSRLREQSQPIIALLKQTDTLVIPASFVPNIPGNTTGTTVGQKTAGNSNERELAYAQDTGAGQGEIIVDLQMDNEAARKAKQEEADRKRQQNAMPIWHQRSTVSHVEEPVTATKKADNEEADEDQFAATEHDEADIDREECCYGIALVCVCGLRCYRCLNQDARPPHHVFNPFPTHLPFSSETRVVYAKYYASLTQEGGGEATPAAVEEWGYEYDSTDVEDKNVNGKRGYVDDDGIRKRSRIDGEVDGEEEIDEVMDEEMPLVIVGGEMIPLDEVTEDHQQQMSSEEYQAYYDLWKRYE